MRATPPTERKARQSNVSVKNVSPRTHAVCTGRRRMVRKLELKEDAVVAETYRKGLIEAVSDDRRLRTNPLVLTALAVARTASRSL
jgi:hypothetical protein